jgi:hypothetical protein
VVGYWLASNTPGGGLRAAWRNGKGVIRTPCPGLACGLKAISGGDAPAGECCKPFFATYRTESTSLPMSCRPEMEWKPQVNAEGRMKNAEWGGGGGG